MLILKLWYNKSGSHGQSRDQVVGAGRWSPWLYSLIPLSLLYRGAVAAKRWCYRSGWCKTTEFSVPIIVIGNLTVGGTGKTPMLIALAQFLQTQGYQPGIVSRGYGAKTKCFPYAVSAQSNPREAGDEPVLIARRTGCPVVIGPNRVAAVQALLATNSCDVILSDDGLQHYALGRSLELVMIDGERRFGNGLCLPAGPLREPVQRLNEVDFIICQGGSPVENEWQMDLLPGELYNLRDRGRKFSAPAVTQVHAFAGIGNPARFFRELRNKGFSVIEHIFPDHHNYFPGDIAVGPEEIVIMTEKDAVKCQAFAQDNYWCLPVTAQCDQKLWEAVLQKLTKINRN